MINSNTEHPSQAILQAYFNAFSELTPNSLKSTLTPMWDQQVEFKDPFNHVYNRDHCVAIFEHMFNQCIEPKFTIQNFFINNHQASVYWHFSFKLKTNGSLQTITGNSLVEINHQGLISKHIDYWDAAEQFYEKLPFFGSLIRWIKRRLKVEDPQN
jgi:steroid delta-isomerase